MQITKGKQIKAQRVVLYGPEGIGKTSFASKFPDPLFVDVEKGSNHIDVSRTECPQSWQMFADMLVEFQKNPMGFGTLVIDTADALEALCIQKVCAEQGKAGIEEFGYGKGYVFVAESWGKFLSYLTAISEGGINVVLLAHAHMRKFEQPDELGAYDRWELKLSKRCAPLTKEWADLVLFANFKTHVLDVDGKKKAQGGKRVIHTTHHPCWDAKNRHDLPQELPFDFEQIASCIPHLQKEGTPKEKAQPETEPDTAPKLRKLKTDPASFCPALWDLMDRHQVTEEQIRRAVAAKEYYPEGTPIHLYDQKFIEGVLVAAWPRVLETIEQNEGKENE